MTRPTRSGAPPRWRRTSDARAIIDAVVPLLVQHGGDVTTKQIAEAAGIAEGTIFRVFPDKRALLLATAEETINPEGGREAMAAALADVPDLRDKVVLMAEQMIARMERGMLVMMALRSVLPEGGAGARRPQGAARSAGVHRRGQPGAPRRADRPASSRRTRNELRVEPAPAALVLRSLVFGTWHPGMHDGRTTDHRTRSPTPA